MNYYSEQAGMGALGIGQGVATSQATETQRAFARELYEAGLTFFDRGDYASSLARFTEAYNTVAEPVVLVAIGKALTKLERYQDALYRFQRYLREQPQGGYAEDARAQAEYLEHILQRPAAPSVPKPSQTAETPIPPEVPASVPERSLAPPPPTREVYDDGSSTIAVWVVTGVGVLGLVGVGWWLTSRAKAKKRPKPNRRRRRRTSRR